MFKITLPADRAVIDMAAVAEAFGIGLTELENQIHIGTISQWYEVGDGDKGNKPHHIFDSETLGIRVNVDEIGNVRSSHKTEKGSAALQPNRAEHAGADRIRDAMNETSAPNMQADPDAARRAHLSALLDEALDESFPASDPASDPVAISFEPPSRVGCPLEQA